MNVTQWLRRGLVTAVVASLAGCQSVDTRTFFGAGPPTGTPCKVVATWHPEVYFAPDTVNNGTPMPGLVGTIHLFGADIGYPLAADGTLIVDLYDCTSGQPVPKEEWRIDPESLKKYQHKDTFGWGYMIFLPWATYNRDISQVQLKIRFDPSTKGTLPLFSDPSSLAVNHPVGPGTPAPVAAAPSAAPSSPQKWSLPPAPPAGPQAPVTPAAAWQKTPAQW